MPTMLEGSYVVPADKETVWAKLNDPAVLKSCISGVQVFDKTSDTEFVVVARVKIGLLKASIRGRIELRDVEAPDGCRILGEGTGGIAGFARGTAAIRLTEAPGGTSVAYAVDAVVGGRLAQIGGRLLDGMAHRLADKFFVAFTIAVVPGPHPDGGHFATS